MVSVICVSGRVDSLLSVVSKNGFASQMGQNDILAYSCSLLLNVEEGTTNPDFRRIPCTVQ